jgi:uncharacterized repeat protein (TIGR02543 family)
MDPKKLLTTLAIALVVLIAGCKKDDFVETPGVCPEVISTNPANLATSVHFDQIVTATFNEEMNPVTITQTSYTLSQGAKGEALVDGTVSYSGTTASFTPSSALTPSTTYTGRVKASVKDLRGNALQEDYVWTFSTGVVPTVILADPLNLATGVALKKVVRATFSEAMDPLTITATSFTLKNGVTPVAGAVTYAGAIASFTPSADLLPGTVYTATITTGAKSVPGIPLASNFVWTFTTAVVPTVILADPLNLAIDVALNKVVRATFSEAMDPLTITATSFTLMNGVIPVAGAVTYAGSIASFTPSADLLPGTLYTATITTGAKSVPGVPLASNFVWTFTTISPVVTYTLNVTAVNGTVVKNPDQATYISGTIVELTAIADAGYVFASWSGDATGIISPKSILMNANKNVTANFTLIAAACTPAVDLGLSGDYVILSKAGISTTGTTAITGNMGVSPITSTGITGDWALNLPPGGTFSTSIRVTGNIYASDYAPPTPANLTTAISNMETAYTTANGLVVPAPVNEYMAGNLNGQTLTAGIYKWSSNVDITNGIILDGGGDNCASFIFQIAGDLTVANSAIITLQNGAEAKNIFWVVAGSKAALGTAVDFSGNILCKTLISLNTGAKVLGRLLAQTAVTLNASTVVLP